MSSTLVILVQSRIAKIDRTAFAEVALEEGIELVEQFFTKIGKWLDRFVDVRLQLREPALLLVARFDSHQVDISRLTLHFCSDENITQSIQKLLFKL
jgi:CRP-like cAMP-binding protein